MLHKLQYISQGNSAEEHITNIQSVLDAGVQLVQLRLKNIDDKTYSEYGKKAKELCSKYNAHLIINDNPLVAKNCSADAVHLGLNDMGIHEAVQVFPGKIIGGTANTFEHIQQRCSENVDYIGLGPFRFTTTKEKLSPVLGTEGYKAIIAKMKEEKLEKPIYAIGGIELNDIAEIMNTGVYGIAVSGLLTKAADKKQLVKDINTILYHA